MADEENKQPIPEWTGPEPWDAVERRRRRRLALGVAAVMALAAIAAGVVGTIGTGRRSPSAPPPITPARPTTATVPEPAGVPTPSVLPTAAAPPSREQTAPEPALRVAFRKEGTVRVARLEDGVLTGERGIAPRASEHYALSPDARSLAVVDASGSLDVHDLATGVAVPIGPAAASTPVWSSDSSTLYYVRLAPGGHFTEVVAVPRTGGRGEVLGQGDAVAAAIDGSAVAWAAVGRTGGGRDVWIRVGSSSAFRVSANGLPISIALGSGRLYYATVEERAFETTIPAGIWSMGYDGTSQKLLVSDPAGPRPFGFGDLRLSADGKRLAFAEIGDDGYSRVHVMRPDGTGGTSLSVRRDTYFAGWWGSAGVLVFEGNTDQGEPSRLLAAGLEPLTRTVLATEAHR